MMMGKYRLEVRVDGASLTEVRRDSYTKAIEAFDVACELYKTKDFEREGDVGISLTDQDREVFVATCWYYGR